MKPRSDAVYLQDMLDALAQISEYATGQDHQSLSRDAMRLDAIVRRLEIVGEAARKVSEELKRQHPDVPWGEIDGMRHRIVHDYANVDTATVWDTVKADVPALQAQLRAILTQLPAVA